jgi:hypothetical protein
MVQEASPKPSPFAADVLTLVSGTVVAQVIAIIASPVLTRLYGPETNIKVNFKKMSSSFSPSLERLEKHSEN